MIKSLIGSSNDHTHQMSCRSRKVNPLQKCFQQNIADFSQTSKALEINAVFIIINFLL